MQSIMEGNLLTLWKEFSLVQTNISLFILYYGVNITSIYSMQVKLDPLHEVLTSLSGHHGSISNDSPVVIRSLTFTSNLKMYGPFGSERGTHFSFPMSGGKIVGFHGRSGQYLDSIGFYLKQAQNSIPSKALIPSQTNQIGYNMVEGTFRKGYDIVLSLRDREGNFDDQSNNYTGEVSSYEFSGVDPKKKVTRPLPCKHTVFDNMLILYLY